MFSATRVLLCTFFASCLFSSQFLHARGHVVDTNVGRALKSRKAAADPVLQDLLTNNQAWASITERAYPGIFKTSSQEQHPQALWIGCSDSRVPESQIVRALPGVIFAHRNIANQIPPNDANVGAVIAYAVESLNVTRIIVAGHTNCDALQYCYDHAATVPHPPPSLLPPLPEPALNTWLGSLYSTAIQLKPGKNRTEALAELTQANVQTQVNNVAGLEVVKSAWAKGVDLKIVGWLYELETGHLVDLGICVGRDASNCAA